MAKWLERAIVAALLVGSADTESAAAQRTVVEVETSLEAETSPIGVRHGIDGALGRYLPAERLTSRDRGVRLAVAQELGRFGPTEAVLPVLHDALAREGDRRVRLELLRSIARRASPASVRVLAEVAASGLDAEEEWAFLGLAAIGGSEAAEPLIRCLSRARPSYACVDALVELGAPATPSLLEASRTDPRAIRLIEALGRLGDAAAVPVLVERATEGEAPIRAAAVTALGAIGSAAGRDAVLAALGDGSQWVVAAAITALATVGRASDVERLVDHLDAYSPHLDLALHTALTLDAEGVAPRLATLARDGAPRLRAAVARAAIAHPRPALLPVLEQALAVDRDGALDALASLEGGVGLPVLLSLPPPREGDPALAFALARALRTRGGGGNGAMLERLAGVPTLARAVARDPSVRPELLAALASGDAVGRADAARAWVLLGGPTGPLVEALEVEPEASTAAALLAAIDALGGRVVPLRLFRFLDDPRTYAEAARLLAARRAELSAVRAHALELRLHRGLRDPRVDVRAESALALAAFGDGAALPALVEVLADPDPRVRLAAAQALVSIGGSRGLVEVGRAARVETAPELRARLRELARGHVPDTGSEDLLVVELEPAPASAVRVELAFPDGRVRTLVTRERWLLLPLARGTEVDVQASDEDLGARP